MTADVNVTEKVARALYVRTARDNATHDEAVVPWEELHPYQQDRWLSYAADALAVLADPEVLAGIAGVVEEHAINGRRTWQWVYCACRWVAKEETTDDGYREHREHVAAAVVERLRKETNDQGRG